MISRKRFVLIRNEFNIMFFFRAYKLRFGLFINIKLIIYRALIILRKSETINRASVTFIDSGKFNKQYHKLTETESKYKTQKKIQKSKLRYWKIYTKSNLKEKTGLAR
jgi:hypothetical protein